MAQAHPAEIPAVQAAQCSVDHFSHGNSIFTPPQFDEGWPCTGGPWVIRIWERKGGRLHAVCEHAAGLSGPIAWQPNGRHLYAACPRAAGQPGILLYESNGLQHGGFDLHGQGEEQSSAALCLQCGLLQVSPPPGLCLVGPAHTLLTKPRHMHPASLTSVIALVTRTSQHEQCNLHGHFGGGNCTIPSLCTQCPFLLSKHFACTLGSRPVKVHHRGCLSPCRSVLGYGMVSRLPAAGYYHPRPSECFKSYP